MVTSRFLPMDERFLFIAGHACLDYVNTEVISQGQRVDLLRDYADLAAWQVQAGLLGEAEAADSASSWADRAEGRQALALACSMRQRMREAAEAMAAGRPLPGSFFEAINGVLRKRAGYEELEPDAERCRTQLRFVISEADDLLSPVAHSASDFFCSADPTLVKKCGNPACILYFYDTTKNHTRRWCSMTVCGNRMKVAAHQRRAGRAKRVD